jgi:hypothetical protein
MAIRITATRINYAPDLFNPRDTIHGVAEVEEDGQTVVLEFFAEYSQDRYIDEDGGVDFVLRGTTTPFVPRSPEDAAVLARGVASFVNHRDRLARDAAEVAWEDAWIVG